MEYFEKSDFEKIGKFEWSIGDKSISIPPFNYGVIDDPEEALEWIDKIFEEGVVGADTEGNSLNWEMPDFDMHGFSLANRDMAIYIYGRAGVDKEVLKKLESCLNNPEKIHAWYNYNYDRHVLAQYGVHHDYSLMNAEDAQIMTGLDNRQDLPNRGGLKGEAFLYLKYLEHKPPSYRELNKKSNDLTDIDEDLFLRYSAFDARLTYDLYYAILSVLEEERTVKGDKTLYEYYKEIPKAVLGPIYEMEKSGMYIDEEILKAILKESKEVEENTTDFWRKITGCNPQSPTQKAHFFFDVLGHPVEFLTDEGNPSTDELSMKRLVSRGDPYADIYINVISPASKTRSTYAEPFKEKIAQLGKPYIHGNLEVFGTRTGRLSSSNPNLQNITSKGRWGKLLRQLFSAPPGFGFFRADYSQLELRVLAHYTKDPLWLEIFEKGEDPHQMTADEMGVTRDEAKVFNFGIVYGMTGYGIALNYEKYGIGDITKDEAEALRKRHLDAFPTTKNWLERVYEVSRELGYSQTIRGRKRYLPNASSHDDRLRWKARNKAANFVIQGSAADIMNIGIVEVANLFNKYNEIFDDGSRLVNTVHDEIVGYVNIEDEERAQTLVKKAGRALEYAGEYFDLRVPLKVEPGIGDCWLEVK